MQVINYLNLSPSAGVELGNLVASQLITDANTYNTCQHVVLFLKEITRE
jgi:hypothetical protein